MMQCNQAPILYRRENVIKPSESKRSLIIEKRIMLWLSEEVIFHQVPNLVLSMLFGKI